MVAAEGAAGGFRFSQRDRFDALTPMSSASWLRLTPVLSRWRRIVASSALVIMPISYPGCCKNAILHIRKYFPD